MLGWSGHGVLSFLFFWELGIWNQRYFGSVWKGVCGTEGDIYISRVFSYNSRRKWGFKTELEGERVCVGELPRIGESK